MPKTRIHGGTAIAIYMVALFFDLLQAGLNLIPLIGNAIAWVLGIAAWLTFYLWFTILNVSFRDPKYFKRMLIGVGVEAIPVLNALPTWIVVCFSLVRQSQAEDKKKIADYNKKIAERRAAAFEEEEFEAETQVQFETSYAEPARETNPGLEIQSEEVKLPENRESRANNAPIRIPTMPYAANDSKFKKAA